MNLKASCIIVTHTTRYIRKYYHVNQDLTTTFGNICDHPLVLVRFVFSQFFVFYELMFIFQIFFVAWCWQFVLLLLNYIRQSWSYFNFFLSDICGHIALYLLHFLKFLAIKYLAFRVSVEGKSRWTTGTYEIYSLLFSNVYVYYITHQVSKE